MHGRRLLIIVALGGAAGAVARYEIVQAVHISPNTFPWTTFWINLSGAFMLGAFMTVVHDRIARAFFAVGVLGAYTTFSTLATETVLLIKNHHAAVGVAYLLASVALGLPSALIGSRCGRLVTR